MEKLLTVKRIKDGIPFRLPKTTAIQLVTEGIAVYTSKSYAKSFYRRLATVSANEEYLKNIDFSTKQSDNFVMKEGNKTLGYVLRNQKEFKYTLPEEEKAKEEKKSWVESVIERACVNPVDHTLKKSLLAKLLIMFGFFKTKEVKHEPNEQSILLPQYQRFVLGYTR